MHLIYLVRLTLIIAQEDDSDWNIRDPACLGMPPEIIKLFNSFPMGLTNCPYDSSDFTRFLPGINRALQLADIYYRHVSWM